MNIDEIFKKHNQQYNDAKIKWNDAYIGINHPDNLPKPIYDDFHKQAIKEIVTDIIQMCADNAITKPEWSGHDVYNIVDRKSILDTINEIIF